jgi:ribosome-binding protein aMBF1 (putative translation factor)
VASTNVCRSCSLSEDRRHSRRHRWEQYLGGKPCRVSSVHHDRVVERRHPVTLARHVREAQGMSIAQIAERLGRSPATIKDELL